MVGSSAPAGIAPHSARAEPPATGFVPADAFEAGLHKGGLSPTAARRICEHLEAHLRENVPLATLAAMAGLSIGHFVRAFKQTTGMPPHRYVLRRRIERGRRLLIDTDLPIAQIAGMLGFADHGHFTRHFKRQMGATPGLYRRRGAIK